MIAFKVLCARLRAAIKTLSEAERSSLGASVLKFCKGGSDYAYKVDASEFLQACARVGIDPLTGQQVRRTMSPDELNLMLLGVSCAFHRHYHGLNQRAVAKEMGVSAATVNRVENGTPVSIEATLAVCKFTKTKPLEYLRSERRRAA